MIKLLNYIVHILMCITGQYVIQDKKALRDNPDYDYYGNKIEEPEKDA
jgi:hypothetical protein